MCISPSQKAIPIEKPKLKTSHSFFFFLNPALAWVLSILVLLQGFKKTAQIKSGPHNLKLGGPEFQLKLIQVHPLQKEEPVTHTGPLLVPRRGPGLQGGPGWASFKSCHGCQVNVSVRNIQNLENFGKFI